MTETPATDAPATRDPGTRDKVRTRRAILDAAEQAFIDDPSVSLADVARAAGVSKSGLLHHFGSREQLLREVVADGMERFRAEVHEQVDLAENRPGKVLRGYIRALCDPTGAVATAFAAPGLWRAAQAVEGVAELVAADEASWRAELAADGLDPDRVLVARFAAEGVAGAIGTWVINGDDLARTRELLLRLAEPERPASPPHPRAP